MKKAIFRLSVVLVCTAVLSTGVLTPANAVDSAAAFGKLAAQFMGQYGLNESNFSFAYYNTVTGETHAFNEKKLMNAASIYKLPLNMYYYEQVALGKISPNSTYGGYSLRDCHRLSLRDSHNASAQAMRRAIGSTRDFKTAIAKYTGVSAAGAAGEYLNSGSTFSATMILNTLKYLYSNSELFSEAIGYLKQADPENFFRRYVSDYEIAQKYGWWLPTVSTAGIVYTPTPYLLCVFTVGVSSETIIGRFNELVCNYTISRHREWDPDTMAYVTPVSTSIAVDGSALSLESFRIDGSDYFKLRDIAFFVNGTEKQFDIGFDSETGAVTITSGRPYAYLGHKISIGDGTGKIAKFKNIGIIVDGKPTKIATYLIGGSNFVGLHDVMQMLDIGLVHDPKARTIEIYTSVPYKVTQKYGWDSKTMAYVTPVSTSIAVDGDALSLESFRLDGSDYFKLRDIAFAVNGTEKQFDIGFDTETRAVTITSGSPYTPVGSEMFIGDGTSQIAKLNNIEIIFDGEPTKIAAYLIGESNFARLSDVMRMLNISIVHNTVTQVIEITTVEP